ncbi:hypothetical protein Oweho_1351 [Owenweeksia hongkongensis DSM 17368]|uniref:DUF4374 domain-containing protein n=1 Tax=Owenweeksia hongkongensis (strain DSM 17368 / CIP 108786 / JCM 12287 / NRRL B-23963 / UST20020801) TaxID=926562 RepID=G8R7J5_OWEHD|nr:hypothetical protein [Owenweeksia hongkongensis]AEV32348.1 hypothetical protein Oweho_1351 [Owenweeksia hongkongensis DSM 17368]
MNRKFNRFSKLAMAAGVAFLAVACEKDDNNDDSTTTERVYTLGYADGSGNPSATYVQGTTDLSEGDITFKGYGFEVPSTRTARIFTSSDGKTMYSLDYGGGSIYKFTVNGGQNYTKVDETNIEQAMGTAYPRWTRINDDVALLHSVATENMYDANGVYTHTETTARVMSVGLDGLTINEISDFTIPMSAEMQNTGDYVFRIDAPVVIGDKVFYGMGKRKYDPATDQNIDAIYPNVETLVLDYPSLENPRIISTNVNGARGATNGYRTSVSYQDERGDVYQITTVPDNTFQTHILKISNGDYDDNYSLNLSSLLGENTISNGWFYVGNGIGYVPYANSDQGGTSDAVWSVARVDLYSNTAVKLNLPADLWLQQYQNSVVANGEFKMAIAPKGGEGYIYSFDVSSTSADAVTQGAKIEAGADSYYIGIY